MEKLMLFTVTVLTAVLGVQGYADFALLQEFCVNILDQSKADASQCSQKPYSYSLPGADKAVVAYLCCLGAFQDVTYDYIQFLNDDLAHHIADMKSEKSVLSVAYFVRKCKSFASPEVRLTKDDYLGWLATGKTMLSCKSL